VKGTDGLAKREAGANRAFVGETDLRQEPHRERMLKFAFNLIDDGLVGS
jgi:hypothetical protein